MEELYGLVTKIDKKTKTLKVICLKTEQSFTLHDQSLPPLKIRDCIYTTIKDGLIIKPPFVLIGTDKNCIIMAFMTAFKIPFHEAASFYQHLIHHGIEEEKIADVMSAAAEQWHTQKDDCLFTLFGDHQYDIELLLTYWYQAFNVRRLLCLGLTEEEINLCSLSCQTIYQHCLDNPYVISTLSLKKCEDILEKVNKTINKDKQEMGVFLRLINEKLEKNSCIGLPIKLIKQDLNVVNHQLLDDYGLIIVNDIIYLKRQYFIQHEVADYIKTLLKKIKPNNLNNIHTNNTNNLNNNNLNNTNNLNSTNKLSSEQKKALYGALNNTLSIITGGAGTGKTTIIKELIKNLEDQQKTYLLTSLTGKAVMRIREMTFKMSSTMHKLIKEGKKCHYDVLIIDEASMVTTALFYDLIQLYHFKQIVLIGDVNQLEPIGPGCLLMN